MKRELKKIIKLDKIQEKVLDEFAYVLFNYLNQTLSEDEAKIVIKTASDKLTEWLNVKQIIVDFTLSPDEENYKKFIKMVLRNEC